MLKRLFVIFCTVLGMVFAGGAYAGEIKFVQVTDTHVSKDNQYSQQILRDAVKDINSLENISFVVFTGDNIDPSNYENLEAFLKIINKLNVRYYLVFGNHDVFKSSGLSKKRYLEIVRAHNWFYWPPKPNYVFKRGEFVFIVLDGAKETIPGTNGYYKQATLEWFDQQLTKYKNRPVVVFQHFPVLPPTDDRSHKVYKPEDYMAVLNRHDNVIAVVSGHYHTNKEKMDNGVYHINSPSLIGVPNPYKIIDIVTTKGFSPMIYTQLREVEAN